MARLKSIGFETGDSTEIDAPDTPYIETDVVRSGIYSMNPRNNRHQSIYFSDKAEIYAGLGIHIITLNAAVDQNFIALRKGTTSILEVAMDNSDFSWRIRVNGVTIATTNPGSCALNTWYYVELGLAIDADFGWAEVKIDGLTVARFDGNTGTNLIDRLTIKGGSATNLFAGRVDDIVVNDSFGSYNSSWTGQPRLIPATVSADGSRIELSRGGVDSGGNWSQVSPVPANTTGYVYSTTAEEGDLYEHAPFAALPTGAVINNLIVVAQGRVESGAGSFATILKSGDMEEEGEIKALGNTFRSHSDAYPVDEGDVPWTLDRVNSAEIGVLNKEFV
jgi:hypothetical protein